MMPVGSVIAYFGFWFVRCRRPGRVRALVLDVLEVEDEDVEGFLREEEADLLALVMYGVM